MGESLNRGFVFSISVIAIASVLIAFSLFYFNASESAKTVNLNLQELRQVRFGVENISSDISNFFDIDTEIVGNKIKFYLNLNDDKNLYKFSKFGDFYNNVFSNFIAGDLNLDTSNFEDGNFEIKFDNSSFLYNYKNKIVNVIPENDVNYIINISANTYSNSHVNWSFSGSGIYVTLNYKDLNYSYSKSGYINGSQSCFLNNFSVLYPNNELSVKVCNDVKPNTLIITESNPKTYPIDVNILTTQKDDINNAYYNMDLNYTMHNSKYVGLVPVDN